MSSEWASALDEFPLPWTRDRCIIRCATGDVVLVADNQNLADFIVDCVNDTDL